MNRPPLLILAVGNPSRGDDALGPLLIDQLQGQAGDAVELLGDFQLQIEHALDLQGRRAVLFVDAAWPGHAPQPVRLDRIEPETAPMLLTHALRPQSLLGLARQLHGQVPPAWLLSITGVAFSLGEGLSAPALAHLQAAHREALGWIASRCRP